METECFPCIPMNSAITSQFGTPTTSVNSSSNNTSFLSPGLITSVAGASLLLSNHISNSDNDNVSKRQKQLTPLIIRLQTYDY